MVDKDPPVADPLQPLHLSDSSDRVTYANSLLALEELKVLEDVLRQNKDVFAWAHSDMLGIHPSIASHRLNIMPSSRLVHQKVRHFHPNRQKIIQSEVDKLLTTRFIREVEYLDWLVNVVVDPHFLCASPLNRQDSLLFGEKLVLEKSEPPLILFYFKRENKTRKKTLKK